MPTIFHHGTPGAADLFDELVEIGVISAAAIATPAPLRAEGLDWTAGMGQENLDEVGAVRGSDGELEACLVDLAIRTRRATAQDIVAVLGDIVSAVDRRAVTGA